MVQYNEKEKTVLIEWRNADLNSLNFLKSDILELLIRQTETTFTEEYLKEFEHKTSFFTVYEFMQQLIQWD